MGAWGRAVCGSAVEKLLFSDSVSASVLAVLLGAVRVAGLSGDGEVFAVPADTEFPAALA